MSDTAVLLNIGDMIDLAIGTPEVGVVDFNMLQTVLHCLAQQLRVLGKNVELRGNSGSLPVNRDITQTIDIREYSIDTDEKVPTKKTEMPRAPAEADTILVVERIKKSESPSTRSPNRVMSASSSLPVPSGAADATHTGPERLTSTERLTLVTLSKFNVLEKAVDDIKGRVYASIPKNEEILQEVRSQTNLKAIQDMWTSLNVSSRLEAAETGIGKLSSLVQDFIGETTELQDALKKRASKTSQQALQEETSSHLTPGTLPPSPAPGLSPDDHALPPATHSPALASTGPSGAKEMEAIQLQLKQIRSELDGLTNNFYATNKEKPGMPASPSGGTPDMPVQAPPAVGERTEKFSRATDLAERVNELEKRMKQCCDSIGKKDGVTRDQTDSFQDQLECLMKQVANLSQELASGKLSPDLVKDLQGLMQLFQTVQEMQEQLKQVHETALQLAAEKDERHHHIDALLEQIELLKSLKLDREDMVEAMAEKADLRMLARKVSHDQFEMACDDLSKGLEHALGKLNLQESLWQQALDDIQREIESKLDKMELSPVKDFFNNKLKQLQENLKQMVSLRKEAEAAGTKRRLMRDVNCISCDAQAVMSMDAAPSLPVSKPMPATFSMKPYLSYELDAIRKTQQSNLPARNMHDWETIEKQMSQPKQQQQQKVRSETDKHLCNRYCGGSHTTTTPAQRVARLGHFIKQWGPDVLPLSSGLAAGDDGRMYRVSPTKANVGSVGAVDPTCTPKSPKKYEPPKPQQKPLTISAECRCLEGGIYKNNILDSVLVKFDYTSVCEGFVRTVRSLAAIRSCMYQTFVGLCYFVYCLFMIS